MKFLFLIVVCIEIVSGKYLFDSDCPKNLDIKLHFDLKAYLGVWYEIERYDQPFAKNADCAVANYSERDATSINVENKGRIIANGTLILVNGIGVVAFPKLDPLPGRLNVSFHGPTTENNYQIIDTDYTNFAVVYNCKPLSDGKSHQFYWLLSRATVLTNDVRVNSKILDIKLKYIDENEVRKDDQSAASCSSDVVYENLTVI